MVSISGLYKYYGHQCAVHNLSFSIEAGEIVGFLGPNGAGKTTTMNILTGYLAPSAGQIQVAGVDILEHPVEAKRHIGYLPEQPPLYGEMTVEEYLKFMHALKGAHKTNSKEFMAWVQQAVGIDHVKKRLIRSLSKGYRQRVGLAQALLGDPEVLILDEPTVGLDPQQIIDMRALIQKLGKHRTVFLSTHILSEVSVVCDRILVMKDGKLIADGTAEVLQSRLLEQEQLLVQMTGDKPGATALLHQLPGVRRVELYKEETTQPPVFNIICRGMDDVRRSLFHALAEEGRTLLLLQPLEPTLEEVFLRLTGGDGGSVE